MQNELSNVTEHAVTNVATQVGQTANEFTGAVMSSFRDAFDQVILLAPKMLAAIAVLVVGYFLARVVGKVLATLSERLGLQRAAERADLVRSLQQAGIQRTIPQIMGAIVFWLLMFVFLMAACNILGLPAVSSAMAQVVAYIPKLLVATVVVVVGLLLATFLRGVIAASADRVGVSYAQQLASGCYYVLALMVFIAAFEQLEITFELLNYAILIAFAAVAIGFGLAFGLGGREVISGILAGYYVRQRLEAGDQVSVAGLEGRVREVGPVATVIETEEDGLLHRHSIPNAKMLNEAVR